MKILIVKLSSLGDVVHALPVLHDIHQAFAHAQIDWVVERSFAPLVACAAGVHSVIPCDLRTWRKSFWRKDTRTAWAAFQAHLQTLAYDAVIDLQGLTKSALVARCANMAPGGKRFAMAHATHGSGHEAPTHWVADVAIALPRQIHVVARSRMLCAQALGYDLPKDAPDNYGFLEFKNSTFKNSIPHASDTVAFIHGSSRADKCWDEACWVQMGLRLSAQGNTIALLHGSADEEARSVRIAQAVNAAAGNVSRDGSVARVWPRMGLDAMLARLASCAGCVGVDSGISHMAVALDLPHVQIYNFDTAWRTGPVGLAQQTSVFARPQPTVDQAWQAWLQVSQCKTTA